MNPPFHCWFEFTGDMWASGGHVVSFNAAGSAEFAVGGGTGGVNQSSPLAGVISAQPLPGQVFLGGSGRNYLVSNGPSVGADFANGYYKPIAPNVWEPPGYPGWTLTLDPDTGDLELHDGTNIVATGNGIGTYFGSVSAGTFPEQAYMQIADPSGGGLQRLIGLSDPAKFIVWEPAPGNVELHDGTGLVVDAATGSTASPTGAYPAEPYGETTYNTGSGWTFTIS